MPQIKKATFKRCRAIEDCRFAPYVGDTVFIVNDDILIFEDEIILDFDVEYYEEIFDIIETVE